MSMGCEFWIFYFAITILLLLAELIVQLNIGFSLV